MGYEKQEVTAHGFRATASTILNSRGFAPDVIEAALAQQDKNEIRGAYPLPNSLGVLNEGLPFGFIRITVNRQ